MSDYTVDLANLLKSLRKKEGLTQKNFGYLMNFSPAFVMAVETGTKAASVNYINALCQACLLTQKEKKELCRLAVSAMVERDISLLRGRIQEVDFLSMGVKKRILEEYII